ncbi:MAG TPA: hypothetical protein VIU46_01720 [Gallionellaceae bacterium]
MIKKLLQDAKEQLGWQGKYGIALLVFAGAFHAFTIAPLERQNLDMHNRIDASRDSNVAGGEPFSSGNRIRELGTFYDSLPAEKDVTDIMGAIYGNADAYGVQLKEASYHLVDKDGSREYVMDFPMIGEYARVRLFVSHILAKHPYLALDQIDFRREKISDAKLKANVRFTLFLRPKAANTQNTL